MEEELQKIVERLVDDGESEPTIKEFIKLYREKHTSPTFMEGVNHISAGVNRGIIGGTTSTLRSISEYAQALDRGVGLNKGKPIEDYSLYQLGNLIDEKANEYGLTTTNPKLENLPENPTLWDKTAHFLNNDVPQGIGSTIGLVPLIATGNVEAIVPQLEGKVLSKTGQIAATGKAAANMMTSRIGTVSGSIAVDDSFREAKEAGYSDEEAFDAAIKNYPGGATEGLPLERILGRIAAITGGQGLKAALRHWGAQSLSGGVEESLQEALQQYWQNQVAKGSYDPDRDPLTGVLRAAGSAFLVGAILPTVAHIPNISKEAANKLIRSLTSPSTKTDTGKEDNDLMPKDEDYNVPTKDPVTDELIDADHQKAAEEIEDLLKEYNISEAPNPETDQEAAVPTVNPDETTGQVAPEGNVSPTAQTDAPTGTTAEVKPTHVPDELYHTSKNELTEVSHPETNGILHLWTKLKNKSIGLFNVAPSTTGGITMDNREDAVSFEGKSDKKTPKGFDVKKFGDKVHKFLTTRKLNLLPIVDEGHDLHLTKLIEGAKEANKTKEGYSEKLDKVVNKANEKYKLQDDVQAAVAAWLRTDEGGNYDGISYDNIAEVEPKKTTTPKTTAKKAPSEVKVKEIGNTLNIRADRQMSKYTGKDRLTRLTKTLDKAKEVGAANAITHIEKLIDTHHKDIALKEEEKNEKETIKERKKKQKEESPKPKKEDKKITHEGETKPLSKWKLQFENKVINSQHNKHSLKKAVDEYKEFREANGLPTSRLGDRISHLLNSDVAKKAREAKMAKSPTKKSTPKTTTAEKERSAKEAAAADIAKAFGIDPSEMGDLDFMRTLGEEAVEELKKLGIDKLKKEEIGIGAYLSMVPRSQQQIIEALHKIIDKYRSKENTKLKIYRILVPKGQSSTIGGFHFSIPKSDNSIIGIFVDEATGQPTAAVQNSVLHEYIHEYTKMMFHRLYSTTKSFRDTVLNTFNSIKGEVVSQTQDLVSSLITKKELTEKQADLLTLISTLVDGQVDGKIWGQMEDSIKAAYDAYMVAPNESFLTQASKTIAENIYKEFYGFTDPHELLATAFSDPHTIAFLSKIEMPEKITKGVGKGGFKTALYKWYENLLGWVEKQFSYTEVGRAANNALSFLMDTIGAYDLEFQEGTLTRATEAGMFYSLTPQEVSDLQDRVNPLMFSKVKKKTLKVYNTILNKLAKRMEQKWIYTLDDTKAFLRGVNSHLPDGSKLDIDKVAPAIQKKIKRVVKIRNTAKAHRSTIIEKIKSLPIYKTSWKFRGDVDDYSNVNIDKLRAGFGNDRNEILVYMKGLQELSQNGIPSPEAYRIMINHGKKVKGLKTIVPLGSKLHQTFAANLPHWTNPATLISIISKYNTKVADKLFSVVYGGTMAAASRAKMDAARFYRSISDLAEHHNLTHKDLARVGLYGGIFSTINAPGTEEWHTEVISNAKAAVLATKSKLKALEEKNYKGDLSKKLIQDEIKEAQDILEAITKHPERSPLTKGQQAIYDAIREFAASHEQDFIRNSVGAWGIEDFQKRYNYFPTLAQGSVDNGGDISNDPLIRGGSDNLADALFSGGDKGLYGQVYGKKVWSNYQRLNPRGYFYEHDALAIAKRWGNSMLFDLYATKELKAINSILEDKTLKQEYKVRVREAFKKHLKNVAGGASRADTEVSGLLKSAMKVRDRLYTAALATSGQIVLQSSSGFVAAAVMGAHLNPVTSLRDFSKATAAAMGSLGSMSKLQKFLENEGMGIQLRDILFEKYLTAEDYQRYLAGIKLKGISNKIDNISEWALRSGDKLGARLVWFSAFFNAGGTLEAPTREAVLSAERAVGVYQNMSDMSFSAPAFKYNTMSQKILMGTLFAFKSFSINSALNIWYSTRHSLTSKEARQVLAGQVGSILAYHALSAMIIRPVYQAIASTIGGGDDEDKDEKSYSDLEGILTESLWDIGIGGWSPQAVDATLRWVYNKGFASKIHDKDPLDGVWNQYTDSPIYSMNVNEKPIALTKELLGPGFKEPIGATLDGLELVLDQSNADEFFELTAKSEEMDQKWNEYLLRLVGTAFGGIQGVPFRGDMKRIIEQIARDKASKRVKENKNGAIGF